MKKYYVKTTVNMQPKNKAWEAIQKFAYEQNGILIHGDDTLNEFIKTVSDKVNEIK